MKGNLIELIEKMPEIKKLFHSSGGGAGFIQLNVIYDTPEFSCWKGELLLELQDIHDRTRDVFVDDVLESLKGSFNGWNDVASFTELEGSLMAILKNIDKYYSKEVAQVERKAPKVFLCHSSNDDYYVSALVDLLESIGLRGDQIFCSSVAGYSIPLGQDIYEYLKQQFVEYDLRVFFMLSNNYYASAACLNEMGATWILQTKYTCILLPKFEFRAMQGAVNPRQIAMKLDENIDSLKDKLNQLKNTLLREFNLEANPVARWEVKRDKFIKSCMEGSAKNTLGDAATTLLLAACDEGGEIMKTATLSGISITSGKRGFIESQDRREVAKWEDALNELIKEHLVESRGDKGVIFLITKRGYDHAESLK